MKLKKRDIFSIIIITLWVIFLIVKFNFLRPKVFHLNVLLNPWLIIATTIISMHLYLRWSSKMPLWLVSLQESEFGQVTASLSSNLFSTRLLKM